MKAMIKVLWVVLVVCGVACVPQDDGVNIRPVAVAPQVDAEADSAAPDMGVDMDEQEIGVGITPVRRELVLRDARGEVVQRGVRARFGEDPGSLTNPKWKVVELKIEADANVPIVGLHGQDWLTYDLATGRAVPEVTTGAPVYINGDCLEANLVVPVIQNAGFGAVVYSDRKGGTIGRVMRGGTLLTINQQMSPVTLDEQGRCVSLDVSLYSGALYKHSYTDPIEDGLMRMPGLAPYTVSMEEAQ